VIRIQRAHLAQMAAHVARCAPEEGCGLLAGVDGTSVAVLPVTNVLHSPVRFRMAPEEQLQAMLTLEERGWALLAIFHSHPQGPSHPSPTDIAEAAYPEAVYLIWFREGDAWQWRAFFIHSNAVSEAAVQVIGQDG